MIILTAPRHQGPLEEDSVYRCHPEDWQRYHTRYVTLQRIHEVLWMP